MKIFLAGSTGFLGRHIGRALLDAGHEFAALTRSARKVSAVPELSGARAVEGDVTDPSSLVGRLDGADAVLGAVTFPNYPVEQPRLGLTFDRFDRRGTEHLLQEARRAGVESYLYISGAGADPSSDKSWYRAKGRAEEAIRSSGLRWAALRPSWAYGPGDKALNRLAGIARFSPIVPRLGVRPQRIQPVFVEDIALVVRRIFERAGAWNRVYEIGGPEVLTMDEVLKTMCEVLGRRRLVVPVPTLLAKLATAPLDLLPRPPMNPVGIEFAVQDGLVDITDIERELGVRPVDLRSGLARYLRG
ncbi:complex I NDUFA9 subunit family protein [soil metagenome]